MPYGNFNCHERRSSGIEELNYSRKSNLLMNQAPTKKEPEQVWLKSHQVQRMLGISAATLQNLRVNGTMPYSKVGGVIFYEKTEVLAVLERNKQNG
jgi:hypothetical protein